MRRGPRARRLGRTGSETHGLTSRHCCAVGPEYVDPHGLLGIDKLNEHLALRRFRMDVADQKILRQGVWDRSKRLHNNVQIIERAAVRSMTQSNPLRFESKAARKGESAKIADREFFQYAGDARRIGGREKKIEGH